MLFGFDESEQIDLSPHGRDGHKHIPNSGFLLLAFATASGVWVAFPGSLRDFSFF